MGKKESAKFSDLLKECESKSKEFEDTEFPANNTSIFGEKQKDSKEYGEIEWLRPREFMEKPQLYHDGISPDDIVQGALGDCYFLSSLSVLAEKPKRIEALFRKHKANKWGIYNITLFVGGEEEDVVVDDRIPCAAGKKTPIFSKNKGPELWVLLLEKAYAKAHGSYKAIESGLPSTALSDLTGGPAYTYKTKDYEGTALFDIIAKHDRLDHVMCCSVANSAEDLEKKVGLIKLHAYALIDAATYKGTRLFHIRNPWGKTEWNGAWSDGDTGHWTDDAKRVLDYKDEDDGSFWMAFEDWVKYFDNAVVLILEDGFKFGGAPLELKKTHGFVTLKTKGQTDIYLTAHDPTGGLGMRLSISTKHRPYIPAGGTKESFALGTVVSTERLRLPPGKFYVFVEVHEKNASKLPARVTVSSYSSAGVEFKECAKPKPALEEVEFMLPDFGERFGTCMGCSSPLTGAYMNLGGSKYHKYCVECYFCGVDAKGAAYSKDDKLACADCASGKKTVDVPVGKKKLEDATKMRDSFDANKKPSFTTIKKPGVPRPAAASAARSKAKQPSTPAPAPASESEERPAPRRHATRRHAAADSADYARRIFNVLDADGNGEITADEVDLLFKHLGTKGSDVPYIRKTQIKELMSKADRDGSGSISFKEFKRWWESPEKEKLKARLAKLDLVSKYFIYFDRRRSGSIKNDAAEGLYNHLKKQGFVKTTFEVFIKALDKDNSGSIEFNEFLAWIDNVKA